MASFVAISRALESPGAEIRAFKVRPDVQEVDRHRTADRRFILQALKLKVQQIDQFPDQGGISGVRADGLGSNDGFGACPGASERIG